VKPTGGRPGRSQGCRRCQHLAEAHRDGERHRNPEARPDSRNLRVGSEGVAKAADDANTSPKRMETLRGTDTPRHDPTRGACGWATRA